MFNWLTATINGASCLDLFAGSGALAFESASRGAKQVVLVEEDARIAATLKQQKELLQTSVSRDGDYAHAHSQALEVKNQNALVYLTNVSQQFDVIYLDPPFDSELLEKTVPMILERKLLSTGGVLYVESAAKQELPDSLSQLNCLHKKSNGEVCYALYE